MPRRVVVPLLLFVCCAFSTQSFANDYSWSDRFGGVGFNRYVSALTNVGDSLIVGGDFSHVGPIASDQVALWAGSSWQFMGAPGWEETTALGTYNGEVYGHGFLGPDIMTWDGSSWVSVGTLLFNNSETFAYAMEEFQGKLVIAGRRQMSINGHWGIFTYDGATFEGTGNPPGFGGTFLDLAVYQGDLYAAGYFEMTTDSIPTSGIARWDGATWTPVEGRSYVGGPLVEGIHWDETYSGDGYALTIYDDKLVIAGDFSFAGDLAVSNIASWDGDTQMWEDVGGGSPDPKISNLTTVGGTLYAGGTFTTMGGSAIPYLARWNGSAWSAVGAGLSNAAVALHDYNGALAIGGHFKRAGGAQAEHFAIWNGASYETRLIPGGKGLDADAWSLDIYDGKLIAGGDFEYAGAREVNHVAAWDGFQWSDLDGGANNDVQCVLVEGADLMAGGEFSEIGGTPADYVARWDGSTWHAYAPGLPGPVMSMCVHNGDLHVGGRNAVGFDGFIRRWDGAAWQTIALGQFNNEVRALTSYNGELIAATAFWNFPPIGYLGRHNGTSWQPLLSTHGTIDDNVQTFFHYGGDLYIGGHFAHLGGTHPSILWTAMNTGVWDGTTLETLQPNTMTFPPGASNGVGLNGAFAYAEYDNRLFIGGNPDYRKGAIWSSNMTDPWELAGNDVNGAIYAMVPYQGSLYIAGRFLEVGTSRSEPGLGTSSFRIGYLSVDATGIPPVPVVFGLNLRQNHPNPFNPTTAIHYEIPVGGADVTLVIFDVRGKPIRTLVSGFKSEGPWTATWDGRNDSGGQVASGVYLYRLTTGKESLTRKMMLLK